LHAIDCLSSPFLLAERLLLVFNELRCILDGAGDAEGDEFNEDDIELSEESTSEEEEDDGDN
jgi:hypothetical protein